MTAKARTARKSTTSKTAAAESIVEGAATVVDDSNRAELEAHARRILEADSSNYVDKLTAYQRAASLEATGDLDAATWEALTR
jgi:hypothetical protein